MAQISQETEHDFDWPAFAPSPPNRRPAPVNPETERQMAGVVLPYEQRVTRLRLGAFWVNRGIGGFRVSLIVVTHCWRTHQFASIVEYRTPSFLLRGLDTPNFHDRGCFLASMSSKARGEFKYAEVAGRDVVHRNKIRGADVPMMLLTIGHFGGWSSVTLEDIEDCGQRAAEKFQVDLDTAWRQHDKTKEGTPEPELESFWIYMLRELDGKFIGRWSVHPNGKMKVSRTPEGWHDKLCRVLHGIDSNEAVARWKKRLEKERKRGPSFYRRCFAKIPVSQLE